METEETQKSSMYSRRNKSERGLSKQAGNILEVEDNRLRFDMALACFDRTIDWRCPICHRLIYLGEREDNLRNLQDLFKISWISLCSIIYT